MVSAWLPTDHCAGSQNSQKCFCVPGTAKGPQHKQELMLCRSPMLSDKIVYHPAPGRQVSSWMFKDEGTAWGLECAERMPFGLRQRGRGGISSSSRKVYSREMCGQHCPKKLRGHLWTEAASSSSPFSLFGWDREILLTELLSLSWRLY